MGLSLRTGRLNLVRNFLTHPQTQAADIDIYDLATGSLDVATELFEVCGAAYTLLVPIK